MKDFSVRLRKNTEELVLLGQHSREIQFQTSFQQRQARVNINMNGIVPCLTKSPLFSLKTPIPTQESFQTPLTLLSLLYLWHQQVTPTPLEDSWNLQVAPTPLEDSWNLQAAPTPLEDSWNLQATLTPLEDRWNLQVTPTPLEDSWNLQLNLCITVYTHKIFQFT